MADDRLKLVLPGRVADFYNAQPYAERADDKRIRELTVKKALAESELEQASQFAATLDVYVRTLGKMEPSTRLSSSPNASTSSASASDPIVSAFHHIACFSIFKDSINCRL